MKIFSFLTTQLYARPITSLLFASKIKQNPNPGTKLSEFDRLCIKATTISQMLQGMTTDLNCQNEVLENNTETVHKNFSMDNIHTAVSNFFWQLLSIL